MTELQIRVDDAAAVDALWQLLINQTNGVADQPAIRSAVVASTTTGRRYRLAYDPTSYRWNCQTTTPEASVPQVIEPADLLEHLSEQLSDELTLDHHLHLADWFADHSALLPDLVSDALDVYAMALQQADVAKTNLLRIVRGADLQRSGS